MYLRVSSNWNSFHLSTKKPFSRPAAVGDLWNVGEVNIIGICRDVNGVEVDRPKEGQQASLSQPLIGDEKNCKCCMFFTCWDEMYNNKLVNLITNSYYAPYFLRQKYSLNNRKYKSLWVREDLQKSLTWAIYKKKYINPFLLYVEFASTSWRT